MSNVTIVTPTYNRAELLPRVYESLVTQTEQTFQWLIIDDGSTDETETVIADLQKKHTAPFKITYQKKSNGGKHSALNHSHSFIESDYVVVLDSDDYMQKNGVQHIMEAYNKVNATDRIGWIAFLRGISDDSSRDSLYKKNGEVTNYIQYMNEGRKGEACDVYLTEVFRAFPYPEIVGEKFVSESYLNIQAAVYGNYNMITLNQVIQIAEYLDEGLTSQGRRLQLKSPKGHAELWRHVAKPPFTLKLRLKGTWLYIAYSFFAKEKTSTIVNNSLGKAFTFFNIPFGYAIYHVWKKQYF